MQKRINSISLSREEIERYSKQILIKNIGGPGQKIIKSSNILVIGAGGLGSPVITHLSSAGIGQIGLIDNDTVELSNLQRQYIHGTSRVGKYKTDSAKYFINELNPNIIVNLFTIDVMDNAITGNYDDKIVTPATVKGVSWEDFANYSRLALGKKIKIFPIPLSVLWVFAVMNSLSLRFFGIGHLSIGKLREFLYVDWSSEDIIKNSTPFTEALRITSSYYQKEKNV